MMRLVFAIIAIPNAAFAMWFGGYMAYAGIEFLPMSGFLVSCAGIACGYACCTQWLFGYEITSADDLLAKIAAADRRGDGGRPPKQCHSHHDAVAVTP